MIKTKMKNLIALLLSMFSMSSFAITEDLFILKDALNHIESNSIENKIITRTIYFNQKNNAVLKLKKHINSQSETPLFIEKELNNTYDKKLSNYVKNFQLQNNLNATGFLDPITWKNIYPRNSEWRKKHINLSIESLEKIKNFHLNHVNNQMMVIHVPSMTLTIYEKDEFGEYTELFKSNTVVGKSSTKTPFTHFEITSIKYNPDWTPTPNILRRSAFKNGELNKDWLTKNNITIFDSNRNRVDYGDVDFSNRTNYRYIQAPGPNNALGLLKFETTSKENIYLHDTNEKNLFQHNLRSYSSGCVRVEKPFELASFLLNEDITSITAKVKTKKTFFQKLPQNLPVYFDYSLAKVNSNQEISFYYDIYKKF